MIRPFTGRPHGLHGRGREGDEFTRTHTAAVATAATGAPAALTAAPAQAAARDSAPDGNGYITFHR